MLELLMLWNSIHFRASTIACIKIGQAIGKSIAKKKINEPMIQEEKWYANMTNSKQMANELENTFANISKTRIEDEAFKKRMVSLCDNAIDTALSMRTSDPYDPNNKRLDELIYKYNELKKKYL